jgi:hypothetical protein
MEEKPPILIPFVVVAIIVTILTILIVMRGGL